MSKLSKLQYKNLLTKTRIVKTDTTDTTDNTDDTVDTTDDTVDTNNLSFV